MEISTKEEINKFLVEAKTLISSGFYDFVPRKKNIISLAELGLTIKDAYQIVKQLTVANYSQGPSKDNGIGCTGFVWKFGKDEKEYQIYIKMKIKETNIGRILLVMSFHIADWEITYPYK